MFDTYPTYPQFRSLQLLSPMQRGEDVFALQTALNECGFKCGQPDGILGALTSAAIKDAQKACHLIEDGKAGGDTQKALAMQIAYDVSSATAVLLDCFHGQLELESSFRLGRYSPQRTDGSYDAGIVQRNTKFTSPGLGFDAKDSIWALGLDIRKHYALFEGLPTRRRWALAQGAWNAPAFACYIAKSEGAKKVTQNMTAMPTAAQRRTLEEYVANASAYLKV